MPPTPPPPEGTTPAKVTQTNHYLFGKIVHAIESAGEKTIIFFEDAGKWVKDEIESGYVTLKADLQTKKPAPVAAPAPTPKPAPAVQPSTPASVEAPAAPATTPTKSA